MLSSLCPSVHRLDIVQLGMAKQQLNGPQILRALVNRGSPSLVQVDPEGGQAFNPSIGQFHRY